MNPKPFILFGALCINLILFAQQPSIRQPETYGIVVGISRYHHIKPLSYADKDADLFAELLRSGAAGKVEPGNLVLLKNDSANAGNFWSALSRLCNKKMNSGDRVFIYFAGHGDAVKGLNEYYLLLSDCQPANDGNNYLLSLGAIDMYHLKNRIGLLTRRGVEVILVLDACRTNELPGGYASQVFSKSVIEANVGDIAMLATGPGEVSVEHSSFGNGHGIFTYNLVDGFSGLADTEGEGNKDRRISLTEIKNWVTREVSKSSASFNIRQAPVFCCEDKGTTIISRVDSLFSASWQKFKTLSDNKTPGPQGIKSNRSNSNTIDTGLLRLYNQFNEARKQHVLWGEHSADTYYDQMQAKFPDDAVTEDARYVLAADFINFAQQKINLYLEGKDMISLGVMEEKQDSAGTPEFLKEEYQQMKKAVSEKWTITGLMMQKAGKLLSSGTDSTWLLQLKPKINFLLARGYLSYEAENKLSFEQALACAREAWSYDSSAAYAAECLALMYTYRHSMDRIMRGMFGPDDASYFEMTNTAGAYRRNDTAFYYFRKATQLAPRWVSPYRSLAIKMYGYRSPDTAKQYMQKAISLDTADATSYILMGDLVTFTDSSLYYYHKALATSAKTSYSEIYRKISSVYLSRIGARGWEKGADSAILYGLKAIAADSSNTRAYTNVAWAYERQGKPDSILRYSLAAIRVTPAKFHPYWIAIVIYNRHNKPDSALHYSYKLLAVDPKNGFAASQIARYFDNKKGFSDSALHYFRKSLALGYDKEYCREKIAYLVMARDKQSTEPFDLFYATAQETPFAWRSYYNIACYFANSGKAEQAISFLEKALQRGLKIKTLIDKEPFFAALREQASFKALLAKYFPG